MSNEKQFLGELSALLHQCANAIRQLENDNQASTKLNQLFIEVIDKEKELRKNYRIGQRFHIIAKQLATLHQDLKKNVLASSPVLPCKDKLLSNQELASDEILVYVYLFNAQGCQLSSWQTLLSPRALIDHSVNRPIYKDKSSADEILRTRPAPSCHAYLQVRIKQSDILPGNFKDQEGHILLRLKQGTLKAQNVLRFYHQKKSYHLSKNGELITARSI